ncbi:thioredoxin family protein [Paraglaciecola aquimarina]|uniref:Thioredoxin family protein n=1 Tax=Paraglaciecola aquimarina TaxID=1235557 RepID=A0ABU3SZ15_9ALTE|nr:thioredoxin family protein [Paraglaciecola aquimarina]MDU0355246.1 thioredoxin family protein [Paraglaciecola aquimarina]
MQANKNDVANSKRKLWVNVAKILVLALIVLGVNRLVQSYLGSSAYDNTGLGDLTLSEAIDTAKSSNRLVLADMSAIWCPSCRKLDNQVLSQPDVKDVINQSYVFTRIEYDSEEGEAFMQQFDVSGFPTLLVLNAEGDKLVQLPLTFDPNKFKSLLQQATERFK